MRHMLRKVTESYESTPLVNLAGGKCSVLCVLTLLALAGCLPTAPHAPPPPSLHVPPMYPGAQQPQITPIVLYPDIPSQAITFSTSDESQAVLAFYRDVLRKEGWETYYQDNDVPTDRLHFVWSRGCPLYDLDVLTRPQSGGQTEVELKTDVDLCR